MTASKDDAAGDRPPKSPLEGEGERPEFEASETTHLLGSRSRQTDDPPSVVTAKDNIDDFEGLPWWRRPSVYWLLGPYAVFTLAFGGIIVPKLNLILDLVCKKYFADQMLKDPNTLFDPVILGSDNPQCKIPEVQRNVASFMLAMTLVVGLLSAVVAPKLGHLSDRHGRRRLMAIASCGGLVAECITILAAKFPQTVDYRWLIVGSVFDGITGSFTAGSILSQSYTSDCTHPSKRAVSMGYLHACLFGGLAFGPLISGYFVKWTGSLVSIFYVALGCHLFFIVFVALIIPESLSKRKQQLAQVKWEREKEQRADSGTWFSTLQNSNPLASLKILWPTGKGTSSRLRFNLIALAIADTIILGTAMAVGPVLILYSGYMFNWGNFETSRFVSALSMTRVFVLLVIFPIINYFGRTRPAAQQLRDSGVPRKYVGADNLDIWILRVAMFSDVLGSVGYILSRSETLFVGSGMLTALGGLGSATVQAVVTKHIPPERVGQVVGAIGMLHALTRVVGPVLFNSLYAMTVGTFPQAFLVLLSALYGVGLVCTFFIKPNVHWEEDAVEEDEQSSLVTQDTRILAVGESQSDLR